MANNGMGMKPAGTDGRVFGGDPRLIHVPDGKRNDLGKILAAFLEGQMREGAQNRTEREKEMQPLCPGCYMVVGFDMLLKLADDNGQNLTQLADSMIDAFTKLKANPSPEGIEEIFIRLDPEDCQIGQIEGSEARADLGGFLGGAGSDWGEAHDRAS